jgi:hypothetical protein
MRTPLTVLDRIEIASPCSAEWWQMRGDDRARHCPTCDEMVYDLSGLTADEALALIREKEGTLCVRLYRRADGRVLTGDCLVGLQAKLERTRWGRGLLAVLALCGMFDLLYFFTAVQRGQRVMGAICPPVGVAANDPLPPPDEAEVLPPADELELLPPPDEDG